MAFLQNCFEEGSNLAILSRNYKIPEDNPYGKDLVELIDRMLTVNCRERADMTEVILCLSAIYSRRPLPPRKKELKSDKNDNHREKSGMEEERVGTYRTDGQGISKSILEEKKPVEAKKLNPNSAAARRRKAAEEGAGLASIPLTSQRSSRIGRLAMDEVGSIQLTRQKSTRMEKLKTSKETFHENFHSEASGFGFSQSSEDPFHIGEGKVSSYVWSDDYVILGLYLNVTFYCV